MRYLSQPVFLLIGVQAICLSVGFWFHYQLTVSTTDFQISESQKTHLLSHSNAIAVAIKSIDPEKMVVGSPEYQRVVDSLNASVGSDDLGAIVTDANGVILCVSDSSEGDHWKIGETVTLKSDGAQFASDKSAPVKLQTSDGERVAVESPSQQGNVRVLVYDSHPHLASASSILETLPLSSLIAFLWTLILCGVSTYLMTMRVGLRADRRQEQQDHAALRNAQDLLRTRDAVIFGLAKLAESRDPETGDHLERISLYTTRLATALRNDPKYQTVVTPTFIRLLGISSVLHDIGKVGLEDTVLLKPGKLTIAERKQMEQHTLVAGDCLREIEHRLGASNFLQTAREIALHHHERWDGNGYPFRLAGEEIPLAARIVSIADVYDALRSKRVYKDAFPHQQCVQTIRAGAGTQFDPELVKVFLEIEADFAAIAVRFSSNPFESPMAVSETELPVFTPETMTSQQESVLRDVVVKQKAASDCALSTI